MAGNLGANAAMMLAGGEIADGLLGAAGAAGAAETESLEAAARRYANYEFGPGDYEAFLNKFADARLPGEEPIGRPNLVSNGYEGYNGGAGNIGKYIDNTKDPLTQGEKLVVDDLVSQGKTIERIPRDPNAIERTPDFYINNVKTELKTLENANTNTGMKRIQKGFSQGAESVIIDARTSGLTRAQADEIVVRVRGKYPNGKLPGIVEIWIDGQVIKYS